MNRLSLIVGLTLGSACSGPLHTPEQYAKAKELVLEAEKAGMVVSRSCPENAAYVNPLGWASFDAHAKEILALSLAAVCDTEGHFDSIDIIDNQSGKKLAHAIDGQFTVY